MPIIIHVAGTSGSGKSTTVRRVMTAMGAWTPDPGTGGRTKPWGYIHADPLVYVMGTYGDTGTGGCDTIKKVLTVYDMVEREFRAGRNVIFEGLFTMNHTRVPVLLRAVGAANFHVVCLTTDLETCSQRVDARRAAKGKCLLAERKNADHAMKNLQSTHTRAANYASKMGFLGARVHRVSSDDAVGLVLDLLQAPPVVRPTPMESADVQ